MDTKVNSKDQIKAIKDADNTDTDNRVNNRVCIACTYSIGVQEG
jgi:hypothetical protein